MFEKIRNNLVEKLCNRENLITWLQAIIDENNNIDFKFAEVEVVNETGWKGRLSLMGWFDEANSRRKKPENQKDWENAPIYRLNSFLRKLIMTVKEKQSLKTLEELFTNEKAENLELKNDLALIESIFLKKLNCVLLQEDLAKNPERTNMRELIQTSLINLLN